MKKTLKTIIITTTLFLLTGCNTTIQTYDTDKVSEDLAKINYVKIESDVDKAIQNKPTPPTLSDDFISEYIDVDRFEELKLRVENGAKATENLYDMRKGEAKLWEDIINDAYFTRYTQEDYEAKVAELYLILQRISDNNKMTVQEYISQSDIGLTMEEVDIFIKKQAEKFHEDYEAIQKQLKERKTD